VTPVPTPSAPDTQHRPFVSVIMPIRNEAGTIERCLRSVLDQDYPPGLIEVLVADGESDDGTRAIVRRVADQFPTATVTVVDNPTQRVPGGLNRALEMARGDVIVRVDGHSLIPSTYVSRCVELLASTGADNVGGPITAVPAPTLTARTIALAVSSPFGVGNVAFRTTDRSGWVDTVPFGCWHRSLFERVGTFDEELVRNQDDEFNFRIVQAGGRVWLDPSLRTEYEPRATFRALWHQYFEYGFYKVRVLQKRGTLASPRQAVPGVFVAALFSSAAVSVVRRRPAPLAFVAVPYVVASAGAAASTARDDRATAALLPVAFAVLHVAYGTGFLSGLWRYRRAWQR